MTNPRKQKRPFAVIHVGPHKTGSSTIQEFLYEHPEIIRDEDGYVVTYIKSRREGPKNMATLAVCLNQDEEEVATQGNLKTWCTDFEQAGRDFEEILQNVKTHNENQNANAAWQTQTSTTENGDGDPQQQQQQQQQHIVISSEEFDRAMVDIEWLRDRLEPDFEVRIVLYYRWFHDWIGSYINQLTKMGLTRDWGWKKNGPKHYSTLVFPTVTEWLDLHLEHYVKQHTYPVYQRYAEHFGREALTVLDFHDENEDIEVSFFCRGLPYATASCDLARQRQEDSISLVKNTRVSIDWLRIQALLTNVHQGGLTDEQEEIIRMKLEQCLEEHPSPTLWFDGEPRPEDAGNPIRRLCPSRETVDSILNRSLEFERKVAKLLETSREDRLEFSIEEDFRNQFNESFCTLDADHILRRWEKRKWFKELLDNPGRQTAEPLSPVNTNTTEGDVR